MVFICGINDHHAMNLKGGRPPKVVCKEEFETFDELLQHIKTKHRREIHEAELEGLIPSLESLRHGA